MRYRTSFGSRPPPHGLERPLGGIRDTFDKNSQNAHRAENVTYAAVAHSQLLAAALNLRQLQALRFSVLRRTEASNLRQKTEEMQRSLTP
jgi:hypothetical protein